MLDSKGVRQLAYLVRIDNVTPIPGYDRVELAHVGGWTVVVGKDDFKAGDIAIYFEIDSKLPERPPFSNIDFLVKKHYKIKTQKMCKSISQGLLMSVNQFDGWYIQFDGSVWDSNSGDHGRHDLNDDSRFLTEDLGITYAVAEDNKRKRSNPRSNPDTKFNAALARHPKIAKKCGNFIKKHKFTRRLFLCLFGKKKDDDEATYFPTHLQYVRKSDQERCENMSWVLNDKTPFIVTQKCDGSSGTYILEKKKSFLCTKYEFYVCSRNVRQLTSNQKTFYDENYYWECAIKYDIENKLRDYLNKHPHLDYVCWQGEVCSPKIQGNPHGLTETHLFCFHMIDSEKGRYDIREAAKIWKEYNMEMVPIINENYILPDDFEEFKSTADGFYDPSCCEGKTQQKREGFVYYKTTDPNFSFKNVSREYLLKHS